MPTLCDDDQLSALVAAMHAGSADQLAPLAALLKTYPDDARLHFLRGSMLIGAGQLIEAHRALSRAVALQPDFAIARFQLGLFQLTSGEAENALETWGRLDRLPDTHYLRKFVDGLRCLIRDDFIGAVEGLGAGIALNEENQPLNHDMQLLIDQCRPLIGAPTEENAEAPVSETSLILKQFTTRRDDA